MKKVLIFGILGVILGVVGCVNYKEETTLNMDGSAVVVLHIEAEYPFANALPSVSDVKERPCTKKFESRDEEGVRIIDAVFEYDNFNEAVARGQVGLYDSSMTIFNTDAEPGWSFKTVLAESEYGSEYDGSEYSDSEYEEYGEEMAKAMLSGYYVTHVIHFPGKVLDTNGEIGEDGKTVTWMHTIGDYQGQYLYAEGAKPTLLERLFGSGVVWIVIAVLAVLLIGLVALIIVVVIVVLVLRRGRRK
jgi:hypothetical protein